MSARAPGTLRTLRRLLPFFRPYLGMISVLLLSALGFSISDVARAWLVQPLFDRVMLRGGELRGQARDELLVARLADPEQTARIRGELEALPAPRGPELAALVQAPQLLPPLPAGLDPDLAALLERTSSQLEKAAAAASPDDPDWAVLGRGVALQRHALTAVGPPRAALASLRARELALQVGFAASWRVLLGVFGAAIGLAVVLAVTHYLMHTLARILTARVYVDLQNLTTRHLLGLSLGAFSGGQRGDLLSRLTSDLQQTSLVIGTFVSEVVLQSLRLAALGVAALLLSWQLSLGLLVLGVTMLLPIRAWGKRIRRAARRRQDAAGQIVETMQQVLAGIREVKAFQREGHELERYRERVFLATAAHERTVRARIGSRAWVQFMNDVTIPFLFLLGGWVVIHQLWGIDAGRFGAFLGLALLTYMPAKGLGQAYGTLHDGLPSVERVLQLLDLRAEVVEGTSPRRLEAVREGFRLEGVGFRYAPDGPWVLEDVSVQAPAGTVTALVGPTGSGKSTLIDLLCRHYDPVQGRVLVDGCDLRELALDDYLGLLAVVPQESFLFHDTIRENIRYGRLDASDAEVEEAARLARIHDEILALKGGYDYVVGERGGKLSGGQVQRLSIARAVLRRPQVLILDEATSALDTHTERLVQEALEALMRGTTTFVIAHRLSTVQRADQILVLEGGRVREAGRHDELLARGGRYASLVARQLEG